MDGISPGGQSLRRWLSFDTNPDIPKDARPEEDADTRFFVEPVARVAADLRKKGLDFAQSNRSMIEVRPSFLSGHKCSVLLS